MATLANGVTIDTTSYPSPNYTHRNQVPATFGTARKVEGIAIHWWDRPENNPKFDPTCAFLARANGNTSAHYVIEDGRVAQLVHPDHAAWHSGNATGNATLIGIECNPRMSAGDLETLAYLIAYLEGIYGSLYIYGHKDWSATECPGSYYPKIDSIVKRVNEIEAGINVAQSAKPQNSTTAPAQASTTVTMPVTGYRVTQAFNGGRTKATNLGGGHTGIDYATPMNTPVKAVENGTVLWADWASKLPTTSWADRWYLTGGGYMGITTDAGIVLVIDHGDYLTVSAHLNRTDLNTGDRVKGGDIVGYTGDSGYTEGAHLHFEVLPKPFSWSNGFYGRVDPEAFIAKRKAVGSAYTTPVTATPATVRPYWTVEPGDTLSGIVWHYYRTTNPAYINMVASYNGIANPARIEVGQKIYIPARKWTVDPGDTWESIARIWGYDTNYLKSINPGKTMTVGTTLKIW